MSQWSRYVTAEFPREAISTIDQNILHGQCLDMPRPGAAYACFQSYIHTVQFLMPTICKIGLVYFNDVITEFESFVLSR